MLPLRMTTPRLHVPATSSSTAPGPLIEEPTSGPAPKLFDTFQP